MIFFYIPVTIVFLLSSVWYLKNNYDSSNKNHTSFEFNTSQSKDFNFDCGIRNLESESRIINGISSKPNRWPWIISIRAYDKLFNKLSSHHCGGSIINHNTILTAAHCVYDLKGNNLAIIAGVNNIREKIKISNLFYAKSVIYHENYSNVDFYKGVDIALIRLTKNLNFSKNIQPICLPPPGFNLEKIENKALTLIGWGSIDGSSKTSSLAENLQEANLKLLNYDPICSTHVSYNPTKLICALGQDQNLGSNACYGDSGGPLMKEINNTWYIVGVSSFIITDDKSNCYPRAPSYHTQIASKLDWIHQALKKL
ncbi:unnamed protein product [Brachionus calyciflorus]|uniref:Peptidase S1 domain-containing protein n=1 Tax=Brachionus calyciflorus TaxID=104777 RepID=A0A813NU68_9BILA|nr:unnamed protein product [Brachionus calyciflorus]